MSVRSGYSSQPPSSRQSVSQHGPSMTPPPRGGDVMELEHCIGVSGILSSVHSVPNSSRFLAVTGGTLVYHNLSDIHDQKFLRGHDDAIRKFVLSEDGQIAVTGQRGRNADVCMWRVETGELLRRLEEHEGDVLGLSLSPDLSIVASIGAEKRLVFTDTSNGGIITHTPLNLIIPAADQIHGVFFGPRVQDNKRRNTALFHVAVVSSTVLLMYQLDPFAGELHPVKVNLSGFARRLTTAKYSTNGDLLLLGSEAGDVAIVNTQTGTFTSHTRICAGGILEILVMGSLNQNDAVAATATEDNFRYAKFGPGSQRRTVFFVGGGDGSVAQVSIEDHLAPQCRITSKKQITGMTTSLSLISSPQADRAQLLVGSHEGNLFTVDMGLAQPSLNGADLSNRFGVQGIEDSVAASFTAVVPHPSDPDRAFTAATDGFLRCWDLNTYRQTQVFSSDSKTPQSLYANGIVVADGLELQLSVWSDGAIRCHDLTNTKLLWTHAHAHRGAVTAIALSPSLKYFVTGSTEGDIKVWDIRTREVKLELKDHNQAIVHLQLFDDDRHLLSGSKDRMICTWDLSTGRRLTAHEAHSGPLTSALLSRNQTEVYTAGVDHRVHVYDLRRREPARSTLYCAPPSEVYVTKLRRSVDERMLVTGGTDQVVRLWDPRNLSTITTGFAHSGVVTDCAFTSDNKQVLSCGAEGSLMIWNVYA